MKSLILKIIKENKETILVVLVVIIGGIFVDNTFMARDRQVIEEFFKNNNKCISELKIPRDVKIVALGECTHGNSRLQSMRWDLFKTLSKDGYTNLLLECSHKDGKMINDYINGRSILTDKEVAENISEWIYKIEEMAEFFSNLKKYNEENNNKVKFYGIDMQDVSSIFIFFDYYNEINPNIVQKYIEKFKFLDNENNLYNKENNEKFKVYLDNIKNDFYKNKKILKGKLSDEKIKEMEYIIRILEQNNRYVDYFISGEKEKALEYRENCMFENISFLTDNLPNKEIFYAHLGHVVKSDNMKNYKSSGELLKNRYGKSYYVVGTTIYKARFNAINISKLRLNSSIREFKYKNKSPFIKIYYNTGLKESLYQINKSNFNIFNESGLLSIGAGFENIEKLFGHCIDKSINKSVDSIIILREDSPTKLLSS